MRLIHEDLTYQLRGFCYQTYNSLGPGFNEKLYQEICFSKCLESVYLRALEFELGVSKFAFDLEKQLDVFFEGKRIGKQKVNSIFNDKIWICLTSTTKQPKGLEKKVRSILKSTPLSSAVLANLNGNRPKIKIIRK